MLPYKIVLSIDLNTDVGESFGAWRLGQDDELVPLLSSVNLACGFHAGDPLTLQQSVALAAAHGAAVGAHPSYRDLVGFGRREPAATPGEVYADVLYQLGALTAFLRPQDQTLQVDQQNSASLQPGRFQPAKLHHVKAHGTLYLKMLRDAPTAEAVAAAVRDFDADVPLVVLAGPGGALMAEAAAAAGVGVVLEAFPDRAYLDDGRLAPRSVSDSVLHNPEKIAARALAMAHDGAVVSLSGKRIPLAAQTLYLHGDTPHAAAAARAVRAALSNAGIAVRAFQVLSGFYLRFGSELDEALNQRLQGLTRDILADPHPALTDVIPGYSTLYLEYDAARLSEAGLRRWLETRKDTAPVKSQRHEVSVVYDGPDLAAVAERTGLGVGEVIARHSARTYYVYAVGFTPGLAFMGELDLALRLPRRCAPGRGCAARSVAIADRQTTVYPVTSPGGWHLLGRTVKPVYTPTAEDPLLFAAGDRVQFRPVTHARPETEMETPLELLPLTPRQPLLRVAEPGLLDMVIDRGRFLAGRYGFARSGPLDAVAATRANRLVGNAADTALLELNVQGGVYEVLADGVLAFTGGGMAAQLNGEQVETGSSFAVHPGDHLSFAAHPQGSRGYLALAGGLESRTFRGSAAVDVGGGIGRPLEIGDVLGTQRPGTARPGRIFSPRLLQNAALWLLPGPQATPEALAALTTQVFTVGRADRMGVQLLGASVPGGEVLSEGVPIGSVQVPPGGLPLLLLHDRGTLGGYHKPAMLHPADLACAGQLRPGQRVRFRMGR